MTWTNNDGLYLKFAREEATSAVGGEVQPFGDQLVIAFDLDYSIFTSATPGAVIVMDNVTVPNGAQIDEVKLVTETAFDSAGDAFVFNMGLVDQDRTTEIDFNGLVAAMPQASLDAAGETQTVIVGHTYAGADIGTVPGNTGLVCVDYDTAAPTAGKAKVWIYCHIP